MGTESRDAVTALRTVWPILKEVVANFEVTDFLPIVFTVLEFVLSPLDMRAEKVP